MSGLDTLSAGQREAVDQFTAVTAQPAAQAITQLRRADWNVELAVARFFDGEVADSVAEALQAEEYARAGQAAAHGTAPDTAPDIAPDTAPGHTGPTAAIELARRAGDRLMPAPRIVPQPAQLARKPPLLLALLLLPFSAVWRLAHGAVGLLYLIFPFLPRFRAPGTFAGTAAGTATATATGSGPATATTTTTVKRSPDPRDTAARFIRTFEEECGVARRLPWFEGGYAQALDRAKTELRFLLVVLQSDEHDDTTEFNRETLASVPVAALLAVHDVLLWGGSVTASSEAYQVAAALGCTHFPFAALITHAPRGTPATASSQGMSVVCKVAGPCAADAFVGRLAAAIDAHAPALARIRDQRAVHDANRLIRDQQNSAYEASLARDRQRAAERRAADEAAARAEADAARRAAEASSLARKREQWRRWRAHNLAAEPAATPAARVSIRTADGKRVVRRFASDASMEEVYDFVECLDVPRDGEADGGLPLQPPSDYTHRYAFRLVSVMPRQVFEPHTDTTVADGLWPSSNLVVEALDDDDDDDGSD